MSEMDKGMISNPVHHIPSPAPHPQLPKQHKKNDGGKLKAAGKDCRKFRPEIGSLQAPGSKKDKREWDHLFYFAPREQNQSHGYRHLSNHGAHNHSYNNYSPKFTKENFLRANCQFIVKGGKNYDDVLSDPDRLVEWEDVEQIVVKIVGEGTSCPICLSNPVSAKITKCGHIYCWPCMLHYLALSDNNYRPCPICYQPVAHADLKSVVGMINFEIDVGQVLEMELLQREKDSMIVTPMRAAVGWEQLFSKIIMISPNEVVDSVLKREIFELNEALADDPHCPEACFIHQALQEVGERENKLKEQIEKQGKITEEKKDLKSTSSSPISPKLPLSPSPHPTSSPTGSASSTPQSTSAQVYHFYQEGRGLPIFLHPLNHSMLVKEFGKEVNDWPTYPSFKIIDKEYHSASEETRKRFKFLRHLPLSTPFILIEVDLSGYLSEQVMSEFEFQLQGRKARRARKAEMQRKFDEIANQESKNKLFSAFKGVEFEKSTDFPNALGAEAPIGETGAGVGVAGDDFKAQDTAATSSLTKGADAKNDAQIPAAKDVGVGGSGVAPSVPTVQTFAQMASRPPVLVKPKAKAPTAPLSSTRSAQYGGGDDAENVKDGRRPAAGVHFLGDLVHAALKLSELSVSDDGDSPAPGNSNKGDAGSSSNIKKKGKKGKASKKLLFSAGGLF